MKVRKIIKLTCLTIALSGVFMISIDNAYADARGIRNNNPGNIRPGANFLGENGVKGGFVTFETPEMGIRAAARNLLTYQEKHGKNTVNEILARWAPGHENASVVEGNYQRMVANALGVGVDDPINLRDPATLEKLTTAIIVFENNGNPYDQSVISAGVGEALKTGVVPRGPGAGASGGIATSIVIPDYSPEQLKAAGCDQDVWNSMLGKYVKKAEMHTVIANQIQVQNQVMATPEVTASCYDQAVQVINTAGRAYNTIASFLTGGGIDSGMLKDYATKIVVNEACSQVNNYLYQTGIGSMVYQGAGMVDGVLTGSAFGELGKFGDSSINAGDIINNSGHRPNTDSATNGNIPTLNSNDVAGAVSGGVGNIWSNLNPFK